MTQRDLDPFAVLDKHRTDNAFRTCVTCGQKMPCEPYQLADMLVRWRVEHALANDGCVPGGAYRDVADELANANRKLAAVEAVREEYRDYDMRGSVISEVLARLDTALGGDHA